MYCFTWVINNVSHKIIEGTLICDWQSFIALLPSGYHNRVDWKKVLSPLWTGYETTSSYKAANVDADIQTHNKVCKSFTKTLQ